MESQASYRLLLVEDSEEQRLIVEQMLLQIDSECYQVDSAASYAEAITFIQRHTYDMLLVDFYLDSPHSALDLMQEVRLLNLPVVVITADEDRTVFLQCFQKGAKEFLNKPVNLVEMQVRLRSVLHARNYERSLLEEIQERRRIEMQLRTQPCVGGDLVPLQRAVLHREAVGPQVYGMPPRREGVAPRVPDGGIELRHRSYLQTGDECVVHEGHLAPARTARRPPHHARVAARAAGPTG